MIDWPSRDEWAARRRTLYADMVPDASAALSSYATAEEIEQLSGTLTARWRGLPPGSERRSVKRARKMVAAGELPICLEDYQGAEDILAPFLARRDRAQADDIDRLRLEIAARPIGDDAWSAELRRREALAKREGAA